MKLIHISNSGTTSRPVTWLSTFFLLFHVSVAKFLFPKSGNATLDSHPDRALLMVLEEGLDGRVLDRVEEEKDVRLGRIMDRINVTFTSLEKNSRGAVGGAAARYSIHRYFVNFHGLHFKGLKTAGDSSDSASPIEAMGDRIPSEIKDLLESRIDAYGLDLHDLAVVTATFEDMISGEASARLRLVLQALKMNGDEIHMDDVKLAMENYAATWLMHTPLIELTPEKVMSNYGRAVRSFNDWSRVLMMVEKIITKLQKMSVKSFSFQRLTKSALRFAEMYGNFEEEQCERMSGLLRKKMFKWGSGRLRLGDFYGASDLSRGISFSESPDFLRQSGALDESDPQDPMVIIPNYILSPSNCFTSSDYYGICCADVCDSIMTEIERFAAAPYVKPDDILKILSTSEEFKGIFERQRLEHSLENLEANKLHEIAAVNGGTIPIHGRLFAQYLHHVFPVQCPYPHLPGTVTLNGSQAYEEIVAHPDEISKHVEISERKYNLTAAAFKQFMEKRKREERGGAKKTERGSGISRVARRRSTVAPFMSSAAHGTEPKSKQNRHKRKKKMPDKDKVSLKEMTRWMEGKTQRKPKLASHWHMQEHLFSPKTPTEIQKRQDVGMHSIMAVGAVGLLGWGIARMATEIRSSYGQKVAKVV